MSKTIAVQKVVNHCNKLLALPDDEDLNASTREGISAVLRYILFETDNYHGFNYVDWINGGFEAWRKAGSPQDNKSYLGDQSKKFYY